MSEAWLSKSIGEGRVLCLACSFGCKLNEGEYGVCGVRKVENSKLKLTTYSLASALNIDPIEKKPFYHFLPSSKSLSVGTVGCNFSCKFCQNYEISQYPKENSNRVFGKKVTPEQIVEIALKNGCKSISYTYNEPVVFFEYAYDTAKLAYAKGIKNVFVTSGYESKKAIDTIKPYLDALNIDLKSFSEEFYKNSCGAELKPVLETIKYTHKIGLFIEITTLLIPTLNDSESEIREMAKFIASVSTDIPWHLSAFFPTYKMTNIAPTPHSTLLKAYKIAKEEGLKYVYLGNIRDTTHSSTYCPECGEVVIKRDGRLGEIIQNSFDGICKCGYEINGIWK